MVKRIVLFMPPHSRYNVIHHFTKQMYEAFQRSGVECKLLEAKYNDPKPFLEELFAFQPDITLSFNGLLPDDEGNFFCDMINIPHIAVLLDSPNRFLSLINSKNSIVSCPDRFSVEFFKGINFNKVFFLPHGVGKDEHHSTNAKRNYDVVFLGSALDYDSVLFNWRKQFPKPVYEAMVEAADVSLADNHTPYYQAFVTALDKQLSKGAKIDTEHLNYPAIFEEIETYICSKDRVELIRNIKDAKVHIIGEGTASTSWKKLLQGQDNVTIHPATDFNGAIDIMRQAKIVLNSKPTFKNGAHERVFYGIAQGALVISSDSLFLKEALPQLPIYQYGKWDDVNKQIQYYLNNEGERQKLVESLQKEVAAHHTFDERAKTVLEHASQLVKS